jgi:hypothetical protein
MHPKHAIRGSLVLKVDRINPVISRRSINTRSLIGRKCIITGASRGIGKAIAQRFAEEGASCTLVARGLGSLEEVAASLAQSREESGYHMHRVRAGDVADRGFWESLARESVCEIALRENPRRVLLIAFLERCRYLGQCSRRHPLLAANVHAA